MAMRDEVRAKFSGRPAGLSSEEHAALNRQQFPQAVSGLARKIRNSDIVDVAIPEGSFRRQPGESGVRAAARIGTNAVLTPARLTTSTLIKSADTAGGILRDIGGGIADSFVGRSPRTEVPVDSPAPVAKTPATTSDNVGQGFRSFTGPYGQSGLITNRDPEKIAAMFRNRAAAPAAAEVEVIAGERAPERTSFRNPDATYPNQGGAGYSSAGIYTDAEGNRRTGYYHEPADGSFQPHAVAFGSKEEAMRNLSFADQEKQAGIRLTNEKANQLPRLTDIEREKLVIDSLYKQALAAQAYGSADESAGRGEYYRKGGFRTGKAPKLTDLFTNVKLPAGVDKLGSPVTRDATMVNAGGNPMLLENFLMQGLDVADVEEAKRPFMQRLIFDTQYGGLSAEEAAELADDQGVPPRIVEKYFGR